MSKDYYNLLGVGKDASDDEIKKAYRKMAHKYHPDKEGGDEGKFKEVNEAYQVLSDPKKRKMYDQFGEAGVNSAGGGPSGGMNWEDVMRQSGFGGAGSQGGVEFDLGDIFSEFFGGGRRRGGQGRQKGQDIQMNVEVTFEEAAFGIKKRIDLYKTETCSHCKGNLAEPGTPIESCSTCNGSGVTERLQNSFFGQVRTQVACDSCRGEGKTYKTPCSVCSAQGIEKKETQLEVAIPAGIDDGQTIRIQGRGEAGLKGAQSGDLFLHVRIIPSSEFQRDGDTVVSHIEVPYSTLVLGAKIPVRTIHGEMMMKVPAGTAAGTALRLRGKGIPHVHGSGRGDHIVFVTVEVPKRPTGKLKKILKELAQLE